MEHIAIQQAALDLDQAFQLQAEQAAARAGERPAKRRSRAGSDIQAAADRQSEAKKRVGKSTAVPSAESSLDPTASTFVFNPTASSFVPLAATTACEEIVSPAAAEDAMGVVEADAAAAEANVAAAEAEGVSLKADEAEADVSAECARQVENDTDEFVEPIVLQSTQDYSAWDPERLAALPQPEKKVWVDLPTSGAEVWSKCWQLKNAGVGYLQLSVEMSSAANGATVLLADKNTSFVEVQLVPARGRRLQLTIVEADSQTVLATTLLPPAKGCAALWLWVALCDEMVTVGTGSNLFCCAAATVKSDTTSQIRCFGLKGHRGPQVKVRDIFVGHKLVLPLASVGHLFQLVGEAELLRQFCEQDNQGCKVWHIGPGEGLLMHTTPDQHHELPAGLLLIPLSNEQCSPLARGCAGFYPGDVRPASLKVNKVAANRLITRFLKI